MSDLSFRHVFPGETAVERCVRIAMHIADMGKGSRDLLEPGARTVPWTCLMTLRAIFYHAHLRPEDGWKFMTIDGESFGDDYARGGEFLGDKGKIGSGFDERILGHWGVKYGGIGGKSSGPWPIEPGMVFCTGQHVGFVCHVRERAPGVYDLFTVEGGQVDGAIGKGTRSWTGGPGEEPRALVIDDRRADDHAQRFMRTWTRDVYGKVPGMLSAATLNAPGIIGAPAMSDEELAARAAHQAELSRLASIVSRMPASPLEGREVLPVPED